MNKETSWYDEVQRDFIRNISDSYTLNLATSILEDRKELLKENQQLQNNWNELKKHLEEVIKDIEKLEYADEFDRYERQTLKNILSKMQELESRK